MIGSWAIQVKVRMQVQRYHVHGPLYFQAWQLRFWFCCTALGVWNMFCIWFLARAPHFANFANFPRESNR